MIRSMTGFGRAEELGEKRGVSCDIRAVNHRYPDIGIKLPRKYAFAEEKIRALIKKNVARGKVDVFISIDELGGDDIKIRVNEELARQYFDAVGSLYSLAAAPEEQQKNMDISALVSFVASRESVLVSTAEAGDEEALADEIAGVAAKALSRFNEMREREGEKLKSDILERAELLSSTVDSIEERAPSVAVEYREKLEKRMNEILEGSVEIPADRILLEAAIFADKAAINEELVRLKSHISQLRETLESGAEGVDGGIGKKLDFLVQEMNREANTIGSKSNDLEITKLMLLLKAEIEKIREQVQNIE